MKKKYAGKQGAASKNPMGLVMGPSAGGGNAGLLPDLSSALGGIVTGSPGRDGALSSKQQGLINKYKASEKKYAESSKRMYK